MEDKDKFWDDYLKWREDCLIEFNEKYGAMYGERKYHSYEDAEAAGDADKPDLLVEFSENGSAYPHGAFGIGYIPDAVRVDLRLCD